MDISSKIEARRIEIATNGRKEFAVSKSDVIDIDKHVIRIKFANFGNKDSDGDILVKGCFAKSIVDCGPESATNRKISFLWQHDRTDPIGRVLKIEEMEDGAYAEVQLSNFDAVPNAKRAWHQLQDGDINQFSFGFRYVWEKVEYDDDLDAYIVKEVDLYEISAVTFGANPQTEFIGTVKSLADVFSNASPQEKAAMRLHILSMIKNIEPAETPAPSRSIFEKIGKNIN